MAGDWYKLGDADAGFDSSPLVDKGAGDGQPGFCNQAVLGPTVRLTAQQKSARPTG